MGRELLKSKANSKRQRAKVKKRNGRYAEAQRKIRNQKSEVRNQE